MSTLYDQLDEILSDILPGWIEDDAPGAAIDQIFDDLEEMDEAQMVRVFNPIVQMMGHVGIADRRQLIIGSVMFGMHVGIEMQRRGYVKGEIV